MASRRQALTLPQSKRRRATSAEMSASKSSSSGSLKVEPIPLPDGSDEVTRVRPGVLLKDGCEVATSISGKASAKQRGKFPQMAELSIAENEGMIPDEDFNDRFPDEILQIIFKYVWRPVHWWEAAKVCKRWCILLANNQLLKRSNHVSGRYPCTGPKKGDGSLRKLCCSGSSQMLKLSKVESEWRLAMDLLNACKRHTHSLEIKDCTHVSFRGYQLIAAFASNLKSIRLESCNSMDEASFDSILDRCASLRSVHLSMVPKLALKSIEKAPKLQELHVYGCATVTPTTILFVLNSCPNLRSLCLSAMGISCDWDSSKLLKGPPVRLQNLELANTLAVSDGFLQAIAQRLPNVRKLDFTNCLFLSDAGLQAMIASCSSGLQKLVVTRCPQISDDSVRALAGVASNLHDISMAGTKVSDDGLKALLESEAVVSKLRHVSVAGCQSVTDAGLQHFASKQKQLVSFKTLDVQSCPEISMFGFEALRNSMTKRPWKIVSEKRNVMISI